MNFSAHNAGKQTHISANRRQQTVSEGLVDLITHNPLLLNNHNTTIMRQVPCLLQQFRS